MTIDNNAKQIPNDLVNAVRSGLAATAITGIVLGLIAIIWTGPTLLVVAILFGIALIVLGLFRIYDAFASNLLSTGWRFVLALTGVVILAAGIIALLNPEQSLNFLAIFIGLGWIFQGVADLAHASSGSLHTPRWLLMVSGLIGIVAGIIMIALPGDITMSTFVWVSGIALIVVSIVTLLTLPKRVDAA